MNIFMVFCIFICYGQCLSFYDILGVSSLANQKEIKKAYYRLALTKHPDKIKNPTEDDIKAYMDIVKAYETLSNPDKKAAYDLGGGENDEIEVKTKEYTDLPFSFRSYTYAYRFEAYFNPKLLAKTAPIIITLPVQIDVLYKGLPKQFIHYNRTTICSACHGTKVSHEQYQKPCPVCNGTGLREYPHIYSASSGLSYSSACNICDGSGYYENPEHSCKVCNGHGILLIDDYVEVSTTKGIRSDKIFTFKGHGHEQYQHRRGDVIVKLALLPHPVYYVDGYNLHYNLTISIIESLQGFTRLLKLPSNETLEIKVEKHETIVFKEKGIPINISGLKGALFVHIHIYTSYILTSKEYDLIDDKDILLYLHYQDNKMINTLNMETGYLWSLDEFKMSSCCLETKQCKIDLFTLMLYY